MLCIFDAEEQMRQTRGSVIEHALAHSFAAIDLDKGLKFDPLFLRHFRPLSHEIERFRPDVIHVTGVNDISILGILISQKFDLPLIATWHTNVHEFGARRSMKYLPFLPAATRMRIGKKVEELIFRWAMLYHKIPQMTLAPNPELVDSLKSSTGRPARLMMRGIDRDAFGPKFRTVNDGVFRFGYVGRLQAEKNVRLLAKVAERVPSEIGDKVRFLIVGEGSELPYLRNRIPNAEFTGFLTGRELAAAYANMDVFLFPSETDAFGNVVQEANSSGVPVVVADKGGPKFLVQHGVNGMVAASPEEFVEHAITLLQSPAMLREMKKRSAEAAAGRSWDEVFREVYHAYRKCIELKNTSAGRFEAEAKNARESVMATRRHG